MMDWGSYYESIGYGLGFFVSIFWVMVFVDLFLLGIWLSKHANRK